MSSNRFFVKLSDGKRGVNLDLVTDWTMNDDGILFINFGGSSSDSGTIAVGEDAEQLLRLLNALSIDLETFDRNQLAAEALREKWIQKKLDQANVNGATK